MPGIRVRHSGCTLLRALLAESALCLVDEILHGLRIERPLFVRPVNPSALQVSLRSGCSAHLIALPYKLPSQFEGPGKLILWYVVVARVNQLFSGLRACVVLASLVLREPKELVICFDSKDFHVACESSHWSTATDTSFVLVGASA